MDLSSDAAASVVEPMVLEARSSPPGGSLSVDYIAEREKLILELRSNQLSVLRAMLNSYMGLLSTAVRSATR